MNMLPAILLILILCTQKASAVAEEQWREDAQGRIEQIRKGDLVVRVVDGNETPVPNVPVHIAMERHAFPWGTCVQAARIICGQPDNETYREKLLELFNCAVLENDLKWNVWHGAAGPGFNREQTRKALIWLHERQFRIRGHCLVWPSWKYFRPEGEELRTDLAAFQKRVLEHIDELAEFTRDYVSEWDVVNEPVHHNEVIRALGEDAMVEWFSHARQALPDSCLLFINEYNIVEPDNPLARAPYKKIIRNLLEAGAPLEGIGFQSHFHDPPTTPEEALRVFDQFAVFGLPIVVTEFDINTKDECRQAAFTRDFMTAAFSHPACSGFLIWGFWEGAHWRPDAAMFRKDWSEKPNLHAYRDLVFNEWWTDIEETTDENGVLSVRGFKGDYTIGVDVQKYAAAIHDTPTTIEIVLCN